MTVLGRRVVPPPTPVQGIHQIASVSRDSYLPFTVAEHSGELKVRVFLHLIAIRLIVPPCGVDIGRVTVKKGICPIIEMYNFNGWAIFYLDTQQSQRDGWEVFDTAKPSRHCSRHTGTAGVYTVGPTPQ
jgi:hypothetical protein